MCANLWLLLCQCRIVVFPFPSRALFSLVLSNLRTPWPWPHLADESFVSLFIWRLFFFPESDFHSSEGDDFLSSLSILVLTSLCCSIFFLLLLLCLPDQHWAPSHRNHHLPPHLSLLLSLYPPHLSRSSSPGTADSASGLKKEAEDFPHQHTASGHTRRQKEGVMWSWTEWSKYSQFPLKNLTQTLITIRLTRLL